MTDIEKIILSSGPILSGKLAEKLKSKEASTPEAIRKRISRAKKGYLRSISGFFSDNQSFLYLATQHGTQDYYESLIVAIEESASRLHDILLALKNVSGSMHSNELPNFSFSPVVNLSGHKRYDVIIKDLARLYLINVDTESNHISLNANAFPSYSNQGSRSKGLEFTRRFVIKQFDDWAKCIGIASFGSGKFNSEYGKLQWAYTAPSYVGKSNNSRPTSFVVSDIIIGKHVQLPDIHFFVQKVNIVRSFDRLIPIQPFLLIETIDQSALELLKKNGIIVGFVDKLFGKGYGTLLSMLVNNIANAGAILKANPSEFFKLLEKLDALVDGKTNNLRGDLFEFAVGYYHAKSAQSINISKDIRFEGKFRELDVLAIYADKIVISECKGVKSPFTLEEVEQWEAKIQLVRKWIDEIEVYRHKKLEFELWVTGGFENSALDKCKKLSNAKSYKFLFYDDKDILNIARDTKDSKFLKIIKEYFIQVPL